MKNIKLNSLAIYCHFVICGLTIPNLPFKHFTSIYYLEPSSIFVNDIVLHLLLCLFVFFSGFIELQLHIRTQNNELLKNYSHTKHKKRSQLNQKQLLILYSSFAQAKRDIYLCCSEYKLFLFTCPTRLKKVFLARNPKTLYLYGVKTEF